MLTEEDCRYKARQIIDIIKAIFFWGFVTIGSLAMILVMVSIAIVKPIEFFTVLGLLVLVFSFMILYDNLEDWLTWACVKFKTKKDHQPFDSMPAESGWTTFKE